MKRKRTNLKRYIRDLRIYGIESSYKRAARKFIESMSKPHISVTYTLNGVPMDEFGMNVIINDDFFKMAMPDNFNPFHKDMSSILTTMFGGEIKTEVVNIYKDHD